MDNPLLKYSAKDYFFKAALCHFIVDELNAKVRGPAVWVLMRFTPKHRCSAVVCDTSSEEDCVAYMKSNMEGDALTLSWLYYRSWSDSC